MAGNTEAGNMVEVTGGHTGPPRIARAIFFARMWDALGRVAVPSAIARIYRVLRRVSRSISGWF